MTLLKDGSDDDGDDDDGGDDDGGDDDGVDNDGGEDGGEDGGGVLQPAVWPCHRQVTLLEDCFTS